MSEQIAGPGLTVGEIEYTQLLLANGDKKEAMVIPAISMEKEVGKATIVLPPDRTSPYYVIHRLEVYPDNRGNGYGDGLVEIVLNQIGMDVEDRNSTNPSGFRNDGATVDVVINSDEGIPQANERLKAFYEKHGFKETVDPRVLRLFLVPQKQS